MFANQPRRCEIGFWSFCGRDWIDIIPGPGWDWTPRAFSEQQLCSWTEPQNMTVAFNCKLILAPCARALLSSLHFASGTHLSVTEAPPNLLQIDRKSICQTAAYFNISPRARGECRRMTNAAAGTLCVCVQEMCELNDFRERHTHVLLRFERERQRKVCKARPQTCLKVGVVRDGVIFYLWANFQFCSIFFFLNVEFINFCA